jgi:23S rRNA (adenine2030-N6)-methyltransferase
MLSYRHGFHAGNHADVLKHAVLLAVLDYMLLKEKSVQVIDTHCGAGGYSLAAAQSSYIREYANGIERIWQAQLLPPLLANYRNTVAAFNPLGKLDYYPGSPLLALSRLRQQDTFFGFEMHSSDYRGLSALMSGDPRARLYPDDGFKGLKSLLPPSSRRSLVVIDPSYEIKSDYGLVVASLKDALRRFATGCYLLWYPVLERRESQILTKQLAGLPSPRWLNVELRVRGQGAGMFGSGLWIINPPHVLHAALEQAMPALVESLGQDAGAYYTLEQLAP